MSFIYAEKADCFINIYCDTKIVFGDGIGLSYSKEQRELVRAFGIVKTIIISPEISISFAGNNIFLAARLCHLLYEKQTFSTQELLEMAFDIHINAAENDIEFIIVSCEDNRPTLNCIKERTLEKDVPLAWIGSAIA